jgi:P-type Ca2+ transporter type 2C
MSDKQDPQNTFHSGLSDADAARRLIEEGPNDLPTARPKSTLDVIRQVLREPMFLLLLVTGIVYLILGSHHEAVALSGAIVIVIGITVYQERKTERTLEALRDLSSPRALVIRSGIRKRIPGREVVRGDVLALSEGDRVPADAMVLSSTDLTVDESLLTGESTAVHKNVWDGTSEIRRPGGEDIPTVFSGTLVVKGHGTALVSSTGLRTEMGKLGLALQGIEIQSTNIEKETRSIIRLFAIASISLCVAVTIIYGLTRGNWLKGVLSGLALAISLVPEEFPVVLTVFLALGAWRISKKNVLTRRVPAIEMLGSTTVLCVDKTGTLTMNRMSVRTLIPATGHSEREVLETAMMASPENPTDPMEIAFHDAAVKHGEIPPQNSTELIREYPLSNDLLAMSRVIRSHGGGYNVFAKGAPEAIAQLCRLSGERVVGVTAEAQSMAGSGLRVLGVASAQIPSQELPESQRDFSFKYLGLIGLEDPVRPSAKPAVMECLTAGIRVVMITGDYPATAHSIARQIGLSNPESSLTGKDLQLLSKEELQDRVRTVNVFARVLPEQKLRLVEALKANSEIVAMTGDGVNDAPALKSAHIGIAMGGRGTDVAREAASLVLLDDDFSSIVEAIRLGRRIYDNLKEAMTYIFAIHLPIAGLALIPVLFGLPLVLMPLHIVFLELVIDPACSIVFESEPEQPGIMKRRPRSTTSRIFDRRTIVLAIFQGLGLLAVAIGAFLVSLYRGQGEVDARTISFTALILGNLALIWTDRSRSRTFSDLIGARNAPLWILTAGALVLLIIVLYVPSIREVLQFSKLHADDIAACLGLAAVSVAWFEVVKRQSDPSRG